MRELLLNSRAGWTKRLNCEPKTTFYETDTGHNKTIGARVKTTPQRYAILRSGAPRFRPHGLSMRDGGHYDVDKTSIKYSVKHSRQTFSSLRSDVPRFAMTTRSQQNVLPRPFRRPDKKEHHMIPDAKVVHELLFREGASAPDFRGSMKHRVETTPDRMSAMRKSKTKRGAFVESKDTHLGPGCYNPIRPGDKEAELRRSGKPKGKVKLRKRDVEMMVSDDPEKDMTKQEVEMRRTAHLGPGTYFKDEKSLEVAMKRSHPGVRWSMGVRFKPPPQADHYKKNGSNLNPRRAYVEWVTPGNPMWREERGERNPTRGAGNGADYMPTLDSGPKTSIATRVAKGPQRLAFVFNSAQARLAQPGSVTAASRREFTPCTGPTVGPGSYEPKPAKADDPPPFRKGPQRGDARCWGDNFAQLRPRHLLKASGSTALLDT